ncbi:MAG: hypothetical protein HOG49_01270 [Candidatus Scalindua sp.]|nr:hypothetical protein [Candidatus Scalindua sp.]
MRTKLLNNNPNSMAMIMENFRRYSNEEDIQRVYLLEEGKVHKETSLSTLIEMRDNGEIDTLQLVDLINESAEYEVEQILLEEGKVGEFIKGAKEKIKYAFREKMLTFMYSKVAAYLRATFGQEKKATIKIQKQLSQATEALKSGNIKEAMKLMGGAAFRAALKPIALFLKGLGKVVKGILWIVGKLGKMFRYPLVRVILIAFLVVVAFKAVAVGAVVVAGAKVANQITALATGETAISHGIKATGRAALGALSAPEQQLNEIEDLESIASILGDIDFDSLGAAIISAAANLEGAEVYTETEMTSLAYMGPDGEVIETTTAVFSTADEALSAQMGSIGLMKLALQHIQQGGDLAEISGGVSEAGADAMRTAAQVAQEHCAADAAACDGVAELASTIKELWSGTVDRELFTAAIEGGDEAMRIAHSLTNTSGVSSVTGGAEAAAQIGMGPGNS